MNNDRGGRILTLIAALMAVGGFLADWTRTLRHRLSYPELLFPFRHTTTPQHYRLWSVTATVTEAVFEDGGK
jgi:hypothetical protein